MNEKGHPKEASHKEVCPSCGSDRVESSIATEEFKYGEGPNTTVLSATVPVFRCPACDLSYTDSTAERLRHEAVCRHLKLLTPAEVVAVRKKHRLTRAKFSQLTGIGEASLGRWESGALIQSEANNNYLLLLQDEKNVALLKDKDSRKSELSREQKFRTLSITDRVTSAADAFSLRTEAAK